MMKRISALATLALASACVTADDESHTAFAIESVASFDRPWAMTFLPDGRLLVTEKEGRLLIVTQDGDKSGPVGNVPEVDYGGQGGLGDVVLHPDYDDNAIIYVSYAEAGDDDTRGAAVARARLIASEDGGRLEDVDVIWRQEPKVTGRGHYGHRLLFSPDGHLFVSSGDRQKFDPAQDMQSNLGKILRLKADGSVPDNNPFANEGGVTAEIWSLGHRNPLGIAFDSAGQLWNHEMGPAGGDELNLVERGNNYGYPIVSNGDHYNGSNIPDHDTRPEFTPPKAWWTPVISPSGFVIYDGTEFPDWVGDGFISGLSSQSLVRIEFDGENAREAERFAMGKRIRAIAEGPGGALWLLEDGPGGRLLKLTQPD